MTQTTELDLDAIAPYPATEEQVTADALARHTAVSGQQAWARWRATTGTTDPIGRQIRELTLQAAVDQWAITNLLRAVQKHAPDQADEIALDVWSGWEDGGAVGEWLWEWLTEYGIDPEAVWTAATGPDGDGLLAEVRRLRAELDEAREQLAQAGIGCNCCFVDGHTRRCGRTATTEVDVPPFGVLAVSETCKQRINGTTPAA